MELILEMIMPISYYYIGDLHLFHEAAIRFDDRPFSDTDSFFRKSVIIRRFIGDSTISAYNVGCMKPWMDYEPRSLQEIIKMKFVENGN